MSVSGGLPEHDCRKAFQDWVAHIRPQVSDVSEKHMCPLLWCRNRFEDSQSTVRHTSNCPWLPNACYWCPQCKKPERFWSSGKPREAVPSQLIRRKSSKMRKAKAFFKHFSRKGAGAKVKTDSLDGRISSTSGLYRKPEMDPRPRQMCEAHAKGVRLPEIDGLEFSEMYGSKQTQSRVLELAGSAANRAELSASLLWSGQDLKPFHHEKLRSELSTEEAIWAKPELPTPEPRYELPPLPLSSMKTSEPVQDRRQLCCMSCSILADASLVVPLPTQPLNSDGLDSPESKNCCTRDGQHNQSHQSYLPSSQLIKHLAEVEVGKTQFDPAQLVQPILEPCVPPFEISNASDGGHIDEHGYIAPAENHSSLTCVFGDILASDASWPVRENRFSSKGGLAPTQEYIQDLYQLVEVVNTEWLERLKSTRHLHSRCSALAPAAVFFRGIQTMQRCFNGSLTNEFEDVFSLMHVACASAYMLHKDDKSYYWDEFFDHMLQWQHVLLDVDDVQCFLMAMDQLSCAESYCLTYSLCGRSSSDQRSYEQTFSMLRYGPIMEDCSSLLDGKLLRSSI